MQRFLCTAVASATIAVASSPCAETIGLDPTFGDRGKAYFGVAGGADRGIAALLQADGKVVVAGNAMRPEGDSIFVARFHANGSPDVSFGSGGVRYVMPEGVSGTTATAMVLDGNRVVVVGTTLREFGGLRENITVIRLTGDGALDLSLCGSGYCVTSSPWGDKLRAFAVNVVGGRVVIAGATEDSPFLLRLNDNGSRDTTLGGTGLVRFPQSTATWVTAAGFGPGGDVAFASFRAAGITRILRFTADGVPDLAFGLGGYVDTPGWGIDNVQLVMDGQAIVLVNGSGFQDLQILRVLADGGLDPAFGNGGVAQFIGPVAPVVRAVVVSQGKIHLAGTASSSNGSATFIGRVLPSGVWDSTLHGAGYRVLSISDPSAGGPSDAESASAVLVAGTTTWIAGHASHVMHGISSVVARFDASGNLDPGFGGTGVVRRDFGTRGLFAQRILEDGNGRVVVVGSVPRLGAFGGTEVAVARILANGDPDPSFNGAGYWTSACDGGEPRQDAATDVAMDGTRIVVTAACGVPAAPDASVVFRLNDNGQLDLLFGINGKRQLSAPLQAFVAHSVVVQGNGSIVVGGVEQANGSFFGSHAVVRLLADGAFDPSFGAAGVTRVNVGPVDPQALLGARTLDGSKLVLGGRHANGVFVLRLTALGGVDATFQGTGVVTPPVLPQWSRIDDLAIVGSKILVAGTGSGGGYLLMRLEIDGALDTAFGINGVADPGIGAPYVPSVPPHAIADAAAGAFLGSVGSIHGPAIRISRVDPDGVLDPAFNGDGQLNLLDPFRWTTNEPRAVRRVGTSVFAAATTRSRQLLVMKTAAVPVPAAPSAPTLATVSDTGISATDGITANRRPILTGTCTPGSIVYVEDPHSPAPTPCIAGVYEHRVRSTLYDGFFHGIVAYATHFDVAGPASTFSTIKIDTVAPMVTIWNAPANHSSGSSATFTFTSNEDPVVHECGLDGAPLATCISPITYHSLATGAHTFRVRSVDPAGNQTSPPLLFAWNAGGVGSMSLLPFSNSILASYPVQVVANVGGSSPTGTVAFYADNVPVGGCEAVTLAGTGAVRTATCVMSLAFSGIRPIVAIYSGDASNSPASASASIHVFNAACDGFVDVDSASPFCQSVRWIKRNGITLGCNDGSFYCPDASVTRNQMSAFMRRLGDLVEPQTIMVDDSFGAFGLDAGIVICKTPMLGASEVRSTVRLDAVVSATAMVSSNYAIALVGSNDGVSWSDLRQDSIRGHVVAGGWSEIRDLLSETPVGTRFYGIRVSRDGMSGTGNLSSGSCRLRASGIGVYAY